MKYIILLISLISIGASAEEICKDHAVKEGNALAWAESDFNEESASESMKALQHAVKSSGEIGSCHLPNALAIVQGYVLKMQARKALASSNTPEMIKKYNVEGFCDFLKNSKPCE
jgi:hypothetical protein